MSERERWIVYPLLFLALGAALRDKLAKQTRAKQIVCEELYMVDSDGRPAALLTGQELRFDMAGIGNGLVRANVIDAQGLFERGQPVATRPAGQGVRLPIEELLRLLPQLGVGVVPPAQPVPPPGFPGKTAPPPNEPPTESPRGGPELAPPKTAEPASGGAAEPAGPA